MKEIISDKVIWIDIVAPKEQELEALRKELGLPSTLIDELKVPSVRDKVTVYDKFIYTVLYFPIWNEKKKTSEPAELDIIMNDKYLVTIRYDSALQPINELMKKCESLTKHGCNVLLGNATYKTLYTLVEELLEFSDRQLNHIESKLAELEERIFCVKPNERIIFGVLNTKRDLLDFRRIFMSLHSCLDVIEFRGDYFWGSEAKVYLLDLRHDSDKIWNSLQHHIDLLSSLETTLYTVIDNRASALSRIYTILSFLTWPTLIIISWYQTNVIHLPLIGIRFDAYIVLALAFVPSILIYFYLRFKKLL